MLAKRERGEREGVGNKLREKEIQQMFIVNGKLIMFDDQNRERNVVVTPKFLLIFYVLNVIFMPFHPHYSPICCDNNVLSSSEVHRDEIQFHSLEECSDGIRRRERENLY